VNDQPPKNGIVWWVLWAAFMVGIFQVYYFLGIRGAGAKDMPLTAPGPFLALLGLIPVAISVLIRWIVLPRVPTAEAGLVFFVIGIAMAEASCFIGLFLFPAYKEVFFAFSVLGIVQFIPFFARRYFTEDRES